MEMTTVVLHAATCDQRNVSDTETKTMLDNAAEQHKQHEKHLCYCVRVMMWYPRSRMIVIIGLLRALLRYYERVHEIHEGDDESFL